MKKIWILAVHKHDEIVGKTNRVNFCLCECIENTGIALPFIIPTNIKNIDYYVDFFDAFIIPWGNDIDPSVYWEIHSGSVDTIKEHDDFLLSFLAKAIPKQKPILGICKWMQIINVYFWGVLHQDIANHMNFIQKEEGIHTIQVKKDSFLYDIFQQDDIAVNSLHHQCIKKLGNNLENIAQSSNDKIIEAIRHKEKHIYWVQWHPEYLLEHQKIFDWFSQNISK